MDKVIMWHHPNCTFNSTDTPDGDFCNCRGVVDKRDYDALARQVATLERVSQEDHCRADQLERQLAECEKNLYGGQELVDHLRKRIEVLLDDKAIMMAEMHDRELDESDDDENFDDLPRTGQCGCND